VQANAPGQVIPAGFLGLSFEYRAIEAYAGQDPQAVNPVLEQLIRNLTPGQAPVIRIGGDSTDWTWWPVAGTSRPPGVSYTITQNWLDVTRSLTTALRARLILGINLEADSQRLAAAEADALTSGIGASSIIALEPGNEPELYRSWGWYCLDGQEIPGRPPSYGFDAFERDFLGFARALAPEPLAGPTIGIDTWYPHLPEFLAAEPGIRLVTLHQYPLQNFLPPTSPWSPTIDHLLSDGASRGLAATIAPYVQIAHAHGVPLRIDEMNNVSAGVAPGVADAFASGLWIIDALFQMARVGVDGVNVHTFPGAAYELFRFTQMNGNWQAFVSPEYYGVLMFAQAAPPGSHLLTLSAARAGPIRAWATRGPDDTRTIRVVLINDGRSQQHVALKGVGETATATLERLLAPSLQATRGVTLGGQRFGSQTQPGLLTGPSTVAWVAPSAGTYDVIMPAASAAMLTIP
jgi:hypothetical protein